jgi:hypothetical protein
MTPDEVVQALKELGVSVSRKTIYNWEQWGLIPQPVFRNSRQTDYPGETIAEAYASYKLQNDYGLKVDVIARCRKRALSGDLGFSLDSPPETLIEIGFAKIWLAKAREVNMDTPKQFTF